MNKLFNIFRKNEQEKPSDSIAQKWIGKNRPDDNLPTKEKYTDFKSKFKDLITPIIKEKGFTGSGYTYRLIEDQVVYVINFGLDGTRSKLCCDLGIHLRKYKDDFDYSGDPINSASIKLYQCDIYKRLKPAKWVDDFWWGLEKVENESIINEIKQLIESEAFLFFQLYNNYSVPFLTLNKENFENNDFEKLGSNIGGQPLKLAYISASEQMDIGNKNCIDIINWGVSKSLEHKNKKYEKKFNELSTIANMLQM